MRHYKTLLVLILMLVSTYTAHAKVKVYEGVQVKKLSTGQKLIFAEDKSFPICYVYLVINAGSIWDPPKYEGLTGIMGEMLMRGTKTRSREVLRDELDQLGAEIDVSVGSESMVVSGQTLKKNLDPFLEVFADVILNPKFDQKELLKEKRETIASLKEMRENDSALVSRFFKRALFKSHPYSMSSTGQESTVSRTTQKKVIEAYKRTIVRSNSFFAATGDLRSDALTKKLSKHFNNFPQGSKTGFDYPRHKSDDAINIVLVDKPARTQTQIMVGHLGIDIHHPDYFPLLVANNAFGGGGMTPRLMREVRVKRGWSYGAYSWYRARKKRGEFAMHTFPAVKDTIPALELILDLYAAYVANGVTQEEFEMSKSNLINEFAFKIDRPKKKVMQIIFMELMGLPKNYLDTYQDKLRAVTLEQTKEAVLRQATPDKLTISIVCTARQLKSKIKALGKRLKRKFNITVKNYKAD